MQGCDYKTVLSIWLDCTDSHVTPLSVLLWLVLTLVKSSVLAVYQVNISQPVLFTWKMNSIYYEWWKAPGPTLILWSVWLSSCTQLWSTWLKTGLFHWVTTLRCGSDSVTLINSSSESSTETVLQTHICTEMLISCILMWSCSNLSQLNSPLQHPHPRL